MANELTMFSDGNAFNHGMMVAKVFTNSQLVPQHLRGQLEDCFIALNMAQVMGEHPLIVMQNIHIISGKAGWSSSYMIARANKSGVFDGPINWRTQGSGESLSVTAFAKIKGDEVTATASMEMAKKEGWTKNPKYASMPEHMLRYRAATFLIRLFAPEVMLGIPMAEENEDIAAAQATNVTPLREVPKPRKKPELTQQLEQSLAIEAGGRTNHREQLEEAQAETPHNSDTGEVYTPTEALLGGDAIPEDGEFTADYSEDPQVVPDVVYRLTFRGTGPDYGGGHTEDFATPQEFTDAYMKAAKHATPDGRKILHQLNGPTIALAKKAMGVEEAVA